MERSRRIRYRDYWARRAFGSRVIFDLSCVSIATVMDLMVYAACSPVRRRPASDLITFGNKSIPEMPVHGHDPQSIPEVWGPVRDRQRWLVVGMLDPILVHPVPEGALVDLDLASHFGDRPGRLDHHLHGLVLEFRTELATTFSQ